ncbi:MAG: universal stress protein, partial [Bacteroidia bacterium]
GTLDAALNLSKVFGCTLHLICFDDNCSVYEGLIEEKATLGNVKFEIIRKSNESARAIIQTVKDLKADLLIVPADKNSQTIVNALNIPVLTVKDDFSAKPVKRIVMPIHDKPETRQKVPIAVELAKHFGAVVDIIAVSGRSDEEQRRVKSYAHQADKFMSDKGVVCSYHFELGGKVDQVTIDYAKEKNADIIVIMNDRDSGFFSSSLSEKIIRSSSIPVIVVEPRELSTVGAAGY